MNKPVNNATTKAVAAGGKPRRGVGKHANDVPVGETRPRGEMILQHAAWYLLSHYPKLEEWKSWGLIYELLMKHFRVTV